MICHKDKRVREFGLEVGLAMLQADDDDSRRNKVQREEKGRESSSSSHFAPASNSFVDLTGNRSTSSSLGTTATVPRQQDETMSKITAKITVAGDENRSKAGSVDDASTSSSPAERRMR
jgi:hypothetical protein